MIEHTDPRPGEAPADWSVAWNPRRHGYGGLARFTSTACLPSVGLDQHGHADLLLQGKKTDVAEDLFRQMVDRRWGYSLDPWSAEAGQLIRDATDINRGSGTCLDLALLMCAMAKSAGLRPYLAVARAPRRYGAGQGTWDHAFVVIDTSAAAGDRSPRMLWDSLDPVTARDRLEPGKQSFWATLTVLGDNLPIPSNWLPIDPTEACRSTTLRRRSHRFADAVARGREHLEAGSRFDDVVLIDVVGAHAAGYPELAPRDDATRPVLFRHVPVVRDYVEIPQRRDLIEDLSARTGYVVLTGRPGSGKSLTAALIATGAAGGAGWFLNAEDNSALIGEIAEAAASHLGMDPAGLEGKDVASYAAAGLGILRRAEARWVVVVDNANGKPADYEALPVPGPNQLVIVTTTNRDGWSRWVASSPGDRTMHVLPDITPDERRAWLAEGEVIDDLPATPLLLNLAVRLSRAGLLPAGRSVEDFIAAGLAGLPEPSLWAARALSWLPPVPVDPADLGALAGDPLSTAELVRRGLVTTAGNAQLSIHRSVRSAARERLAHATTDAESLSRLLAEPRTARYFVTAATVTDLEEIAAALRAGELPTDVEAACFYQLGAFQERKDSSASAVWFQHVLELIGDPADLDSAEPATLACGSLQGVARGALRHGSADDRDRALQALQQAYDLAGRFPDHVALQVAASRAQAMEGLLRRQLATSDRYPDAAARREEKLRALSLIEESAQRRAVLVGPDSPDVDRSLFNIPGALVLLAQDEPDRSDAQAHLERARSLYRDVYLTRLDRYRTEELEEVITCVHGDALACYYLALLSPNRSMRDRLDLLVAAHDSATRAWHVRQRLATAKLVSKDSLKSSAIAAKIQIAVLAIGEALGRAADETRVARVLLDARHESGQLDNVIRLGRVW